MNISCFPPPRCRFLFFSSLLTRTISLFLPFPTLTNTPMLVMTGLHCWVTGIIIEPVPVPFLVPDVASKKTRVSGYL